MKKKDSLPSIGTSETAAVPAHETMIVPRSPFVRNMPPPPSPSPGTGAEGPRANIPWSPSIEVMLAKWCDEAKCFEWMHTQTFSLYNSRARHIAVSSAVLTALSGFTNVIIGNQTTSTGFQLSWVFGGLSILVSIIGILQDKLAYNKLASEHRQYATQWSIIRRKIEEELSLPPASRRDCASFLKYIRQDINQVSVEGNSQIPGHIRTACFENFKHVKDFDMPDICGDMEHTRIYDPQTNLDISS